jgi:hypothetical protein
MDVDVQIEEAEEPKKRDNSYRSDDDDVESQIRASLEVARGGKYSDARKQGEMHPDARGSIGEMRKSLEEQLDRAEVCDIWEMKRRGRGNSEKVKMNDTNEIYKGWRFG